MAGEIYSTYPEGATLYAVVRRQSDGYVSIVAGNTFEAWVDGNIANYVIPLTDRDGNYYDADFPTTITTAGKYIVYIFVQVGGSPADGDWVLSQAFLEWDGTDEITSGGIVGDISDLQVDIDLLVEEQQRVNNTFDEKGPDEGARIINL